ncbi:hypothetical protein VTP01DRAFT_3268 [Rhizomucor pusillus]|uniref:uncharacterized protein n=1 Tax=Rhizomucor pusillus TaxID=4840 RepID=UPI003743DDB5
MGQTDGSSAPLLSRDRIGDAENQSVESTGGRAASVTDYGSGVYRYPLYLQPGQFTSLEKLMFFVSSTLLILLCVFIGLYARSSFQDRWHQPPPTIPLPTATPTHTPTPPEKLYCLQPDCILTAARVLQDVNVESDPCDDFYEYACGHWMDRNLLPENMAKTSVELDAKNKVKQQILRILTEPYENVISNSKRMQQELLPPPDQILDKQMFTKLQTFYQSCMDEDAKVRLGVTPLNDMFRTIREYLPLHYYYDGNSVETMDVSFIEGLSLATGYLGQYDIWPLFTLSVRPDPNAPQTSNIFVSTGDLSMPVQYYDDDEIFRTYTQVVTEILTLVFNSDEKNEFGWKSWSAVATARRIVQFEKQLARQSFLALKMERWTMDELQESASNINWQIVMRHLLPEGAPKPSDVLVAHPKFVTDLSQQVLERSNKRTLQLYLIWRTIWKYLDTLSQMFIAPRQKLDAKLSGTDAYIQPTRSQICFRHVDESFPFLLGRYYVLAESDIDAMLLAEHITVDITDAFIRNVMKDYTWLVDSEAQKAVRQKALKLGRQIGYPKSHPNIKSAIDVAEYYSDVVVSQEDFFQGMLTAHALRVKNTWSQLKGGIDKNTWQGTAPQQPFVSYSKQKNQLTLPIAVMQDPFLVLDVSDYVNYASLGTKVAHEFVHGYDTSGYLYNSNGEFGQWWNEEAAEIFENKTQCFREQYSNFSVRTAADGEEIFVDGKRTLDGNIADNGGLSLAYAAWKAQQPRKDRNKLLPGLDRWTPEQLFFLSYARMHCSKATAERTLDELRTSTHAPDKWRVNGPLMNSEAFATAFSCPLNSNMNPSDKCKLW